MPLNLSLRCSGCGRDLSPGGRGKDWENYADLMVACAECLDREVKVCGAPWSSGRTSPGVGEGACSTHAGAIDSFSGRHHFLSNFSQAEVWYEGVSYPSVEHAYQAAKTLDRVWQGRIRGAVTPNEAKRFGRRAPLRSDWERIKDNVMYGLVRQKFRQHPTLTELLLATGERELIEGNWWGDTYWGVCDGVGRNQLGKTLMRVRSELVERVS